MSQPPPSHKQQSLRSLQLLAATALDCCHFPRVCLRRGSEGISPGDDLISDHEARPGGTLHRVQVVLVSVRSRQEEVFNRRGLGRAVLVLSRLLPIERLTQLNNRRPGALELPGGGEETVCLLDGIGDDLLLGTGEGSLVEDRLHQRALALLVVVGGGGERKIRKAREFRIGGVQQVVDPPRAAIRLVSSDVHHTLDALHLRHPTIEAELDGGDGNALEVVDVVEHGVLAKVLREHLLDARHVNRSHDNVKLLGDLPVCTSHFDTRYASRLALSIDLVHEITDWCP
mmetsp:Transcript_64716/g.144581  ORF Transcript_64716/g.144581 Transcript_64716/m.144581 type:complete len:286 (-) Transcript_64716:294-1151(-)